MAVEEEGTSNMSKVWPQGDLEMPKDTGQIADNGPVAGRAVCIGERASEEELSGQPHRKKQANPREDKDDGPRRGQLGRTAQLPQANETKRGEDPAGIPFLTE